MEDRGQSWKRLTTAFICDLTLLKYIFPLLYEVVRVKYTILDKIKGPVTPHTYDLGDQC